MNVRVIPFADALKQEDLTGDTTVIIDVLRATSVMITALVNGAGKIIPTVTEARARKTAEKYNPGSFLLCGKRDAIKIKGFDLGNSPLEFDRKRVGGKTVIMTTSNGTKALNASQKAAKVYIGAFLNARAVAEKISNEKEVILICSGTAGRFSLDDGLCAAMIMEELAEHTRINPDDLGQVLWKTWKSENGNLPVLLKDSFHLNYLKEKGFTRDVDYCLQKNSTAIVPVYENGEVRR